MPEKHAFAPLAAAHFMTTFNSNFMKNALVLLVVASMHPRDAETMSSFVSAIFMIPMIFLSGLGGQLADKHGKAMMAKMLKGVEIVAVGVSLVGLAYESYWTVLMGVVLLQVVGSLFGPVRSSLIPALVPVAQVPSANAWIEGLSFLAMILGLGFLGLVFSFEGFVRILACAVIVAVAVGSFVVIRFVPPDDMYSPSAVVDKNLLKGTWRTLRGITNERGILKPAVSLGWSWFVVSLVLSTIPAMVARSDAGPTSMTGAMIAFGIVGTISAQLAAKLCGSMNKRLVAAGGFAVLAAGVGGVALALAGSGGLTLLTGAICTVAMAHSFVLIPAATAIQIGVPADRRARAAAGSNIVNALFMVIGGMLVAAVQAVGGELSIIYAACGLASLLFAALFLHGGSTARKF
ncbi:MFS transporter [Agrobacterium rubi]|nr:MFS transporter [Agrobacterium rubi]NTF25010.1 MFS transporter [Agrobacterium rubi]